MIEYRTGRASTPGAGPDRFPGGRPLRVPLEVRAPSMAIGNEHWLERTNERTNGNLGDAGTSHTNYGGHLSAPKAKRHDFSVAHAGSYGNNRAPAGRSRESGADHSKKFVTVKPNQLICLSLTNPLRGPLYTHVTEPNTPHVRGAVRSCATHAHAGSKDCTHTVTHTVTHTSPRTDAIGHAICMRSRA